MIRSGPGWVKVRPRWAQTLAWGYTAATMTTPGRPGGADDLAAAVGAADAGGAMFPRGGTVVVGVSGGPDSVALLDALAEHASTCGVRLVVAHLDHGLHPGSVDDAAFVAALAHGRGLRVDLGARDVARMAPAIGRGIEDAARVVRYAFLAAVAARSGAATVAVGHTADDQAESVLLNLVRGAGLDGLRGMAPLATYPLAAEAIAALEDVPSPSGDVPWPPRLARPLLAVGRAAVRAYLVARALTWRDDPTNRDLRFTRNRVRHEVFPLLAAINPAVHAALARTAASVADDLALVEEQVDRAWSALATVSGDRLMLALDGWTDQPTAVRRRLVRRAVARLRGDVSDLGFDHVASVLALAVEGRVGAAVQLPGGLRAERAAGGIVVLSALPPLPPTRLSDALVPVAVPGETLLPGGWHLFAAARARGPADGAGRDRFVAVLDADAVAEGLEARARRPGDRLQPPGMAPHHKTLQDLFVDAHVPRRERDKWPVVVCGDRVVWVPGVRVDARAAVRPETTRVVVLTARPPARVAGSP
jgi:tRNA(Ile)-lysidine synthetase-like protein